MSENPSGPGRPGMRPAPPVPAPPPPYSPFAAPSAAPPRGSLDAPRAPRPRRTLGVIALVAAVVGVVVPAAVAGAAGFGIGQVLAGAVDRLAAGGGGESGLGFLTPVRGEVLVAEVAWWTGTAVGAVALALGIVAAVTARGRVVGIVAAAVAAIGPFVFAAVVYATLVAGTVIPAADRAATGLGL